MSKFIRPVLYLETFLSSLEDFRLKNGSDADFDERVLVSIEKMLPLREDFIEFIYTIFKYQETVDTDKLHTFFEKLLSYNYHVNKPENVQSWNSNDFDNYKFFTYELVLYFISTLLQLKKYNEAAFFINSQYFYRPEGYGGLQPAGIGIFNQPVSSLNERRNNRLDLKRVSVTADTIKSRANRTDITFSQIIQTDLILHYITELRGESYAWFPCTSTYNPITSNVELFERMVSIQHFEKTKVLFDVKSIEELDKIISEYVEQRNSNQHKHAHSFEMYRIPPLEKIIDINKISKIK